MNRQQLIEENMNLVHFVINRYYPNLVGDEDLVQWGMVGLCRAAETWDEGRSAFSTYATSCILHEFYKEFKRRCKLNDVWSLNYPIRNEDGNTVDSGDLVVGDEDVDFVDFEPFFKQLSPIEQRIIKYKQIGFTATEIAEHLGCSTSNVTQYLRKLKRLWRSTYGD